MAGVWKKGRVGLIATTPHLMSPLPYQKEKPCIVMFITDSSMCGHIFKFSSQGHHFTTENTQPSSVDFRIGSVDAWKEDLRNDLHVNRPLPMMVSMLKNKTG